MYGRVTRTPAARDHTGSLSGPGRSPLASVVALQRMAGNRAVAQLARAAGDIAPDLINGSDDAAAAWARRTAEEARRALDRLGVEGGADVLSAVDDLVEATAGVRPKTRLERLSVLDRLARGNGELADAARDLAAEVRRVQAALNESANRIVKQADDLIREVLGAPPGDGRARRKVLARLRDEGNAAAGDLLRELDELERARGPLGHAKPSKKARRAWNAAQEAAREAAEEAERLRLRPAGQVTKGGVTTHVPTGEIVSGEIDVASPKTGGGGGGAGKAATEIEEAATKGGGAATKVVTEAEEALVESSVKAGEQFGVRALKGIGRFLLEVGIPGPEDAIMMMADFAGSYAEAWKAMEQRGVQRGFAGGFAAQLLGLDPDWVRETLAYRYANPSMATNLVGGRGKEERKFNEGLARGYFYGHRHTTAQADKVRASALTALAKAGRSIGTGGKYDVYDVWGLASVLVPTVNAVIAEADRRKEQRIMKEWAKRMHLD